MEIFTISKVYGRVIEIVRFQDEKANDYKVYGLIIDANGGGHMVYGSQVDIQGGA